MTQLKVSPALRLSVEPCFLLLRFFWGRACYEPAVVVASFQDTAMMGEPIKQCGRHLCIAEDVRLFTEAQLRRDDDVWPRLKR